MYLESYAHLNSSILSILNFFNDQLFYETVDELHTRPEKKAEISQNLEVTLSNEWFKVMMI